MSYEDITLRELRQLERSAEAGGLASLGIEDLALLGKQAELVANAAYSIYHTCQKRAHVLMDDVNADNIPAGAFGIERTYTSRYQLQEAELAVQIKALDAHAFEELFEFVPEVVTRTPAHFKVRNTLKLTNWIKKLGVSAKRQQLETLLGQQKTAPKVTFRAVDPETGEVLS